MQFFGHLNGSQRIERTASKLVMKDMDMSRRYDDETLVYHCLSGDETAFTFLMHKYKDLVHAYACQKVRNYSDAEDITQETFIRAYRNLGKLKYPHNFRSWLYTIAANECNRHLSKVAMSEQRKVSLEDVDEKAPELRTPFFRTPTDWQIDLEEAMESLPEDSRIAITMFYMSECSIREISEYLGVSINTVKSKLRRARQKLGNMLENYGKSLSKNRLEGGFIMQVTEQLQHIPQPTIPTAWRGILTRQTPLAVATTLCILLGILGFLLGNAPETRLMPIEAAEVVWLTPPVGNSGIALLAANTPSEDDDQETDPLVQGRSYLRKAILSRDDPDARKLYETAKDKLSLALKAGSPDEQLRQAKYLHSLCQVKLGIADEKQSAEQLQAAQQDEDPEVRFAAAELLGVEFPGMRVVGTVTQSENGLPIPGASISVQRLGLDTTDAAGQFSIDNIRGHKDISHLRVNAEGYGMKLVQIMISNTEPETRVDVEMLPGATVNGRVVDSEGNPIPDARIEIVTDSVIMQRVQTDHAGTFEFKNIEPRQIGHRLSVDHPDFISTSAAVAVSEAGIMNVPNIVMKRGIMLRGSVMDERGNPVRDALVTSKHSAYAGGLEGKGRTDENGQFIIKNLEGDAATIIVDSPQFAPTYKRVTLNKDDRLNTADFILKSGSALVGAVVDGDGNPIEDVELQLETWDAVEYRLFDHHAITDASGKFRMEHLPDGKIALHLLKMDYASMDFYPATVEAHQSVTFMQSPIVMEEPARIYAKVIDAKTGMPVKNFVVKMDRPKKLEPTDVAFGVVSTSWVKGYAFQSDEGEFKTFGDVRGAVIGLQVEAKGYAPAYVPHAVYGEYDEEPLIIRLSGGEQRTGTVVNAESGKPISGASISIFDDNHPLLVSRSRSRFGNFESVISDEAGKFTLPHTLAEEFYLYVTHPEQAASIVGPLYASETKVIRVDIQNGCTITGTAEPKGLMALEMTNKELPVSFRLETRASQDGIYRFDKLTPGKYSLIEMIEGEGFAASGRSIMTELRSGQTEEINFRIENKSSLVYGKLTEADGIPASNIAVGVQFHASEEQLQQFMKLPREKLEEYRSEYLFKYTRTAITDNGGNFKMFGLPPGNYRITARKRLNLSDIEFREHMQKNGKLPEPEHVELIFTIKEASGRTEVNIAFPKS